MSEVLRVGEMEWARTRTESIEAKKYWKQYLMGDSPESIGFDVIYLADEYQQLMTDQLRALDVRGGERFLDLGAGTGNFEVMMLTEFQGTDGPVPEVTMTDLIPEALARGRAKCLDVFGGPDAAPADLTINCAEADFEGESAKLPFEDGAFDKCLNSLVLNYVTDPRPLLKEMRRVLAPGGIAVVSSFKPDVDLSKGLVNLIDKVDRQQTHELFGHIDKEDLIRAIRYYVNSAALLLDLEEQGVFRFYREEDLHGLLAEVGFDDIELVDTFGEPPQVTIAVARK